ncbi:efflux transporter outer membrane subunit [Paraburkholderia caballeronis]|uniref:Efflux transporter, outer membrane factor (OMF) lipoprotein, NodT family n=1 Tax=Paraburkholderia caballeronis TaxID=416943 RepID=A0A1H7IYQ2_9BURK|nr:efflux transporter outer membrane subunit [Paraburkholderia caballeronis]PXW27642.1 NodT family efflux transporter outer membrane factor (OMF) lipoprotein [Paraburkholderia caballeronis]PXX03116.1 NodT family efflux transporter outer membrane factor (OMF) lipoprotein [Paraburkholderia caballeronis]RAK03841.1 NodT family efflux transporter outer membrane factor (OMF) lipoprotein [Paraburkholderia caballeronis]SEC16226.1 efflux transporter, outer membrane factor (OMF) lipoprotein, NodT family 
MKRLRFSVRYEAIKANSRFGCADDAAQRDASDIAPAPKAPFPRAALAAASAALLLAACAFGPGGAPPAMPQPAHYGAEPQPERTVAAQGVSQQFVVGAPPVPQWWTLYRSDALNALVDEGLRNSPNLAAAQHSLNAAREQLRAQVGSSILPTVDALGIAARQRSPGIPALGVDKLENDLFAGLVQVQYTFDLFGATRLNNAALLSRFDMQAFQFDAARRSLAANIVTAAIGSATLHAQIDTTGRLLALASGQADDQRQRYDLGAVSHADALSAQQNADAIAASLPALRQQWIATRHALAVLLGRTPNNAPPDLDLAGIALPEQVPVSVPSELLKARPDIQAADAALKAAAADVGAATAQMFPSITLSAAIGQAGLTWPAATSGAGALWSIGASLTQPIFHGGALLAQRRAALASYEAANDSYRQTVLTAFQNVADQLAALDHDAQALDASSRSARLAETVHDETVERYRLGAVPYSSVRVSEQQWRNARLDEIRYRGARLSDTAALFQAMGNPPVGTDAGASSPAATSAAAAGATNATRAGGE